MMMGGSRCNRSVQSGEGRRCARQYTQVSAWGQLCLSSVNDEPQGECSASASRVGCTNTKRALLHGEAGVCGGGAAVLQVSRDPAAERAAPFGRRTEQPSLQCDTRVLEHATMQKEISFSGRHGSNSRAPGGAPPAEVTRASHFQHVASSMTLLKPSALAVWPVLALLALGTVSCRQGQPVGVRSSAELLELFLRLQQDGNEVEVVLEGRRWFRAGLLSTSYICA